MTRPPVANTVKIENFWTGPDNVSAANIMYGLLSGALSEANIAALSVDIAAAVTAHVTPHVALNWKQDQTTVSANDGTETSVTTPVGTSGGNTAGNAMTPTTCVVVGWDILAHYRGGHPRTYQPGIAVTDSDVLSGRLLSSAAMTAWQTGYSAYLTALNAIVATGGAALTVGTIAYFRHNAPLVPPVFYPYQSAIVRPRLGTQRRRMGKPPL